ncbi:isopeptide-forming domain-containing fimbrial protein [Anaerococcus sp. NML200574]|uniref:isopeptide-forming domain-containing fimbrial protein n=1 Tax=Anaerococcus sp. NML200574 TaxID=2954486 RepID=UPI00223866E6|nr:isopeptide-forming domain-containing fimbrial protein [Anaerococcus sp. NML200574]MCW6677710.1 isopeptide-forming domain-containing fimbrial protein [Anaerococcus sp. NML200574]
MKRKILSLLTAFAMVFGIIAAPFTSASANEAGTKVAGTSDQEQNVTVTLHKIKLASLANVPTKKDNENFIEGLAGNPKEKYVGGSINNIKDFFNDQTAEELAGVKFTYWVFNDRAKYEAMIAKSSDYDTVAKVDAYLGTENVTKKDIVSAKGGKALETINVPANQNRFIWAIETSSVIPGDSKAQKEEEKADRTITGMKAVPFGLALPLFKADGTVNNDIHVYPKNTTANEPKVDKDFKGKTNAKDERKEIFNNIVKDAYVGQEVPYDIETIIPAGAKYKTAAWTDQMTEGLTFNNDVKIMTGEKDKETEWDKANYTVTKDGNGFVLELTEAGLKAINDSKTEIRLLVQYSATVNKNAKVERQERNDVIFHFGNEPHHGNTPYPTKPKDGKLKVTKNFDNVYGDFAEGEEVEVTLIDAHTGKPVENLPDNQTATVTLKKGTKEDQEHEWHGLDNTRQYKVVEKFKPNDEVTYEKQEDGSVKIIDKKTDNPTPKDPEEPGVVVYGHRFQKIDKADGKGLPGAKFVVKNKIEKVKVDNKDETGIDNPDKDKVLAKKTEAEKDLDQQAYAAAEKAYKDAVKAGKADTEIAPLKLARDKAYEAANTEWKWIADTENHTGAYVLESNAEGYFRLVGVMSGKYELIETEAPKGYAKQTAPVPFEVTKDSKGVTTLDGKQLKDEKGFTQIDNKKVTIPQTGGIGSLVFIAAGLAIMGGAFIAYKRSQAVEA